MDKQYYPVEIEENGPKYGQKEFFQIKIPTLHFLK